LHPRDFDRVLRLHAGTPESQLISEVMLRSQSQAAYSPDNIGHFGLALSRYAHFTSPIRRYADLLVHRGLIKALHLGRDGLADEQVPDFLEISDRITETERRAQQAERDAIDRYLTAFMAVRIGERFAARISGVTRFGLFVIVTETGASGIVPFTALADDYWQYNEREQTLTGRRTNKVYRLAQEVEVLLSEANRMTGAMVFQLLEDNERTRSRPAGKRSRGR
jgi:ribonuclease R